MKVEAETSAEKRVTKNPRSDIGSPPASALVSRFPPLSPFFLHPMRDAKLKMPLRDKTFVMWRDVSLALCPLCSAVLKIGFSIRLSAPCPPSSPSLLPLPSPAVFLKTQVFVERESERRQSSFGENHSLRKERKTGERMEGRKEGRIVGSAAHFRDASISLYCRTRKQKRISWSWWARLQIKCARQLALTKKLLAIMQRESSY